VSSAPSVTRRSKLTEQVRVADAGGGEGHNGDEIYCFTSSHFIT